MKKPIRERPLQKERTRSETHLVPSGEVLGEKIAVLMDAFADVIMSIQGSSSEAFEATECYDHTARFDNVSRSEQLLTLLLDLLRVNVDPFIFGTFFLNGNMDFLFQHLSEAPCEIGYASVVSPRDTNFAACWHNEVLPYLRTLGYEVEKAKAIYVVVSTNEQNHSFDFFVEGTDVIGSGFTVDDVVKMIKDTVEEEAPCRQQSRFAGFCKDNSLNNAYRVSTLLLFEKHSHVH